MNIAAQISFYLMPPLTNSVCDRGAVLEVVEIVPSGLLVWWSSGLLFTRFLKFVGWLAGF